jgi:hypothetical protein
MRDHLEDFVDIQRDLALRRLLMRIHHTSTLSRPHRYVV